jgi:hypothetical protein
LFLHTERAREEKGLVVSERPIHAQCVQVSRSIRRRCMLTAHLGSRSCNFELPFCIAGGHSSSPGSYLPYPPIHLSFVSLSSLTGKTKKGRRKLKCFLQIAWDGKASDYKDVLLSLSLSALQIELDGPRPCLDASLLCK